MPPDGPYTKSKIARTLGFHRASFIGNRGKPGRIKLLPSPSKPNTNGMIPWGIANWRCFCIWAKTGSNGPYANLASQPCVKKKRSVYPGKAAHIAPNLVRALKEDADSDLLFSDIFELQLADGSIVRGCFALWKRTRHILALTFDYRMQAELVVSTVRSLQFSIPGMSWHSDQRSQYGAEQTRAAL